VRLSADTIGLFVFPDGRTDNLDDFFAALEENLPSERFLPLWGGGAGNDFSWEEPTYQYCDDEVVSDGVSYAFDGTEVHSEQLGGLASFFPRPTALTISLGKYLE